MTWSDPPNWAAGESMGAYRWNKYLRDNVRHLYYRCQSERATLWHDASIVTAGNALTRVINVSYYNTFVMRQDAPADGDTWTQAFCLAPGFYYLIYLEGLKGTAQGILDFYIDDTYIQSYDFYRAAGALAISVQSMYYYAARGLRHVLKGVVNGKNAGSSNYYISLSKIYFRPVEEGDL